MKIEIVKTELPSVDATVTIFPKAEIEAYDYEWKMMRDFIKGCIRGQGVECYCEYVK